METEMKFELYTTLHFLYTCVQGISLIQLCKIDRELRGEIILLMFLETETKYAFQKYCEHVPYHDTKLL